MRKRANPRSNPIQSGKRNPSEGRMAMGNQAILAICRGGFRRRSEFMTLHYLDVVFLLFLVW
jgi:hypothetical protein